MKLHKTALAAFAYAAITLFISATLTPGCSGDSGTDFMQKSGGKSGSMFFTPPEDGLVMDEVTGLKTMKDVLSIAFKTGTEEATMKNILSSINGEIVGYDKAVNYYQIRFPGKNLQEIESLRLKILGEYKEIELASTIPVSAHKNPYYAK